MKREEIFNPPNIISFARLGLAPLLLIFLYLEKYINQDGHTVAYGIVAGFLFLVAALSDIVDGYLARRTGQITNLGKFLDPLADKVMVITTLLLLVSLDRVEAWIALIIILREIVITGLRGMASTQGTVIAASRLGKRKTVFQDIALIGLLVHYRLDVSRLWGGSGDFWVINFNFIGKVFLYIALFYTVYSGYDYIRKFFLNEMSAAGGNSHN